MLVVYNNPNTFGGLVGKVRKMYNVFVRQLHLDGRQEKLRISAGVKQLKTLTGSCSFQILVACRQGSKYKPKM